MSTQAAPGPTDPLLRLTLTALRDRLRAGLVSAREVTDAHLARIDARNRHLGAFTQVTAEAALAEAAALDERWAAVHRRGGDPLTELGTLHGVPAAWKDLWEVAGTPTTYGTAAIAPRMATADHPVVAQLRAAGTVSLGKTQIPEFGLNAYSENLIAPPARNPLDLRLSPGGSSGGSAAAVADGMLPGTIGNDGGGSIRIPAAACGLVGLKPGFNVIPADRRALTAQEGEAAATSATDGLFVDEWGAPRLVASGPIARTLADTALLFDALMGAGQPAPSEPRAASRTTEDDGVASLPASSLARGQALLSAGGGRPRRLRIGVSTASPFASAYPIIVAEPAHRALEQAARALEAAGHHVELADFRYDPRYPEAFQTVWTSRLADLTLDPDGEPRLTGLTYQFRRRAQGRSRADRVAAARLLRHIAKDCRAQWARYDVVLTPALAQTPRPVGYFTGPDPAHADGDLDYQLQCQFTPFTSMVNVAQLPAGVVPSHRTEAGLSMAAQLIGRPGSEPLLLALMEQIEQGISHCETGH